MSKIHYSCVVCKGTVAIALRDPNDLKKRLPELTVVREYVSFFGTSICTPCYETIKTKEPLAIRKLGMKLPVKIDEDSSL